MPFHQDEVVPGVRLLSLPHQRQSVNVYLLEGDPVTLVDTGYKATLRRSSYAPTEAVRTIDELLAKLGYHSPDIQQVIITHGHFDHFGNAGLLQAHGAKVFVPSGQDLALYSEVPKRSLERRGRRHEFAKVLGTPAETVAEVTRHFVELAQGDSVVVNRSLGEGETVRAGAADWVAIHTPGHERNHLCLYDPRRKLLLSGDHLLANVMPVPLLDCPENGLPRRQASIEYLASLDRIAKLEVDLVLPGHGKVFRDHRAVIARYAAKNAERKALVLRQLGKCPATPYDLSQALYPGTGIADIFLSLSKVMGHLDELEVAGAVKVVLRDGIHHYSVVST